MSPQDAPSARRQHGLLRNQKMAFVHPAYANSLGDGTMFNLWAWDDEHGRLHHGTALLACMIVACNAWNGFLAYDRQGRQPVKLHVDDLLPFRREYYFHVPHPSTTATGTSTVPHQPDELYKYPVYLDFSHWRFPHDTDAYPDWLRDVIIPPHTPSGTDGEEWVAAASSAATGALLYRDIVCLLSRHGDSLDRAYICPRSEHEWCHRNGMQRYNDEQTLSGDNITEDLANAILLRCDIHRAFDEAKFVVVPKHGEWVVHFIEKTTHYAAEYHNRPLAIPAGVARQFLLARFAWALFPITNNFHGAGSPRLVRIRKEHAITGECEEVDEMLGSEELKELRSTGRSYGSRATSTVDSEYSFT